MSSDAKIRTLHVLSGLGIGGAQAMLEKLLTCQDRESFSPAVLALVDRGGPLREKLEGLRAEFGPYGLDFVINYDGAEVVEKQLDRIKTLAVSGFIIALAGQQLLQVRGRQMAEPTYAGEW